MRACALVALGLAACSSSTTSVLVQASLDVPDQVAAPLTVSLFDPRGALIDHTATRAVTLPVRVVLTGVPSRAEDVRVVLTRSTTPPWLGGARVTVIPDGEAQVAVVLSQHTADADADGIPDSVDNCPNVANPDQASASGGAGDACASDAGLGDLPGDGPDGGPLGGPYTFVPTVPQHQSLYYGGHDPPPATVTFTYVADAIACSHDGGAHYAACDGAHAIVFTPADYNQNHTLAVKLSKAGLADFVWTFQPSALEPGLHFYDCDQVVTADESADAFAARLAPNRVVCVSGGVTVRDATMHNDDAGQHINTTGIFLTDTNSTGVKVIGTEANRPTFYNPDSGGDQGVFIGARAQVHDTVFANLKLQSEDGNPISFENAGGANAFSYVDVAVLGGCCDQAVNFGGGAGNVLYNVNVDVHNSGATPAVHLYGNAQVAMTGGHIFGRDDTSAIVVEGASSRSPTPRSTTCSTPAPARPSRRCSSPRAAR